VLKSLVPTQSSQDKEKLSCPFQSTDNFPEWKLALKHSAQAFQFIKFEGEFLKFPFLDTL
jgi:hypothetical protein